MIGKLSVFLTYLNIIMRQLTHIFAILFCFNSTLQSYSQQITQYEVFAGKYDYTAFGNTLNSAENGDAPCTILTESTATFQLDQNQTIIAAYLYWAGSGPGDFDISFNDIAISAERTFTDTTINGLPVFAAFYDITEELIADTSGSYTVSNFDLRAIIDQYCNSATNFGGWAVNVIYEDPTLPTNQVNVFDGLVSVSGNNNELEIVLENLNVIDASNAKVGFIAWEGDQNLAVTETLSFNGNLLSAPPLNPVNNQFNGTNSFTGRDDLFNMDLDVYNIENLINPGDTSATINITSGQDFVLINNVITVLNSQLPDATTEITNIVSQCDSRAIQIAFSFTNIGTAVIPAGTPYTIYIDGNSLETAVTQNPILPNQTYLKQLDINVPGDETDVNIEINIDDNGNRDGIIPELNENNNSATASLTLKTIQTITDNPGLKECDTGNNKAIFNLNDVLANLTVADNESLNGFYRTFEDARAQINPLLDNSAYRNTQNPETLYLRIDFEDDCYSITLIPLQIIQCPPIIPEGFSPNGDSLNDSFEIKGLKNVFDYNLKIYSRYGNLIYEGTNEIPFWDGTPNKGLGGTQLPTGTYFWTLALNSTQINDLSGWVYLSR